MLRKRVGAKACADSYLPKKMSVLETDAKGRRINLLCLNCYLVPPIVSSNPYFWAPFWSCKKPISRADRIGKLGADYDLVFLQEVWGTGLGSMVSHFKEDHEILDDLQPSTRFWILNELLDPLKVFWRRTGGIMISWRKNMFRKRESERRHFNVTSAVPFSNQNVTFVEFDI
eukprot:Trichotokara_eunicae@DN9896_c0_g1_i1.p1